MPRLADYQPLLELSRAMVEQAKACQWEALSPLEDQRRALIAQLSKQPATPANESAAIRQLLEEIQACDAQVREHVEAWREPVRRYILRDKTAA